MNREIKFRFWDKEVKKMSNDLFCNIDKSINNAFTQENLIPLQYTGLKDKSGKEIYEGDILQLAGIRVAVEWQDDFWSTYGGWNYDDASLFNNLFQSEVIGNIYENPELKL
jgi:uncharacterized phage protein (TIGR01671 family)